MRRHPKKYVLHRPLLVVLLLLVGAAGCGSEPSLLAPTETRHHRAAAVHCRHRLGHLLLVFPTDPFFAGTVMPITFVFPDRDVRGC